MKVALDAVDTIPFFINIGKESVVDDNSLQVPVLLQKMKETKEKITTSCPSPEAWRDAFKKAGKSFAVTISSKLSASYESASVGLKMAKEESGAEGYVFDSLSASSGEVLVALKIRELSKMELPYATIVSQVNTFIENMATFFVLDDVSNLVRNGRMKKATGTLVNVLGEKLVLGAKDGEIEKFNSVRGDKRIADKLLDAVDMHARKVKNSDRLIISHCNNLPLAQEVMEKAKERFGFARALIIETRGLSTFYANDRGVIISY
jgi:DegV family protein with EDD domain